MSITRCNYLFWHKKRGKCLQRRASDRRLFGRNVETYRLKTKGHVMQIFHQHEILIIEQQIGGINPSMNLRIQQISFHASHS